MDVLPAPTRVSLDVTAACNLSCGHCRHVLPPGEAGLPFDIIARVIDDAARMGVFRLAISGGEPFLRPDIIDILLHALRSDIGRVFVSTNGLALRGRQLAPLRAWRGRLTFKVSVDGPPRFHDHLRGRVGACKASRQTIAKLLDAGFDVQVTTTVMRTNLRHIRALLDWAAGSGCSRYHMVEVIPVGRASRDMILTPEERQHARAVIARSARRAREGFEIVAKLPFVGDGQFNFRCSAGTDECGVLADGSIVGCRLMPDIVEGNVKETSLVRAWADRRKFALFRRLSPRRLEAPCRTCEHALSCRGGCRAFARAAFGRLAAPDARCARVSVLAGCAPTGANR